MQSPTFGVVGAYEKIAGRAFGEIDPRSAKRHAPMAFARRNGAGMVGYAMDVYLLKQRH